MEKLKIVQYPHPSLRFKAEPILTIDKSVRLQAEAMLEVMYENRGLGLAAPQVAYPFQLLVMNPTADANEREKERVCINPVIVERKGSVEGEEGCLSFPGLYGKVRRARSVKVRVYTLSGDALEFDAVDLEARVVQHEIDHLNGELFIDKMGFWAKRASKEAVEEFERKYRKAQERGEIPPDAEIEKTLAELAKGKADSK